MNALLLVKKSDEDVDEYAISSEVIRFKSNFMVKNDDGTHTVTLTLCDFSEPDIKALTESDLNATEEHLVHCGNGPYSVRTTVVKFNCVDCNVLIGDTEL